MKTFRSYELAKAFYRLVQKLKLAHHLYTQLARALGPTNIRSIPTNRSGTTPAAGEKIPNASIPIIRNLLQFMFKDI